MFLRYDRFKFQWKSQTVATVRYVWVMDVIYPWLFHESFQISFETAAILKTFVMPYKVIYSDA